MRQFKVTNRTTPHAELQKYMNDIRSRKHMTHAEEAELLRNYDNDPKAAREKLVTSNLHFAVSVAKVYLNPSVKLSDLIQEGNEGLVFAAQRFDPTKGVRFISFAVWWIRATIMRYIEEHGSLVYCPRNPMMTWQKIKALQAKGEHLTDDELCERLGLTESQLQGAAAASFHIFEIDKPIDETESQEGYELRGDLDVDADKNSEYTKALIESGLSVLSDRNRDVIVRYYGLGRSPQLLTDIAKDLGYTRARIQQIIAQSIVKMRSKMTRSAQI